MRRRPVAVTIIGWLLVVAGVVAFAYRLNEAKPLHALQGENPWILLLEVVAIAAGAFLLRGDNWARWLAIAWITLHVAFSFLNSLSQVAVHFVVLLLFAYFLFRPAANTYFRRRETAGG